MHTPAADLRGDVARVTDVVRVLVKYGLAQWLEGTEWTPIRHALTSSTGEVLTDQPLGARFRLALADLGTTFIKLGQILGTRPDLVGAEIAEELAKLQQGAPPDPPDVAVATVERELGRPIDECFAEFEREPMASASIAQVHRAKLPNGRRVVVKVQDAGIEGTIHRDLSILAKLAALAEQREDFKRYRPVAVVREFRETILRELDFRREMRNLQRFRRNFAEDKTVAFPKPYPQLTTGRVLTMQEFRGTSVGQIDVIHRHHVNCNALARRGGDVFLQMILRDGFYHADPHPGNIVLLPKERVGILDAGMVGRLDDELREQVIEMLLAAGDQDSDRLTNVICEICNAPPDLDRGALSNELQEVFTDYGTQSVGEFDIAGALTAITGLVHQHKMFMPSRLSMLIKCLIVLEGTARGLNAGFSLAQLLEPYRRQFVLEQMSPNRWLRIANRHRYEWERLAESAPRNLNTILDQLQSGNLAVQLRQPARERSTSRLAHGVCTSALLLASTLLWINHVPPTIAGLSLLGVVGWLLALLLMVRLLWLLRRDEKT